MKKINRADVAEQHLVRPSPTQNAICRCNFPKDAKWIAERLNVASKLEKSIIDALGETKGKLFIKQVMSEF